jgi:regulatory protein
MRMLAKREHSAVQLKRKLAARGHDDAVAADVVADMTEAGWQSDARFAETLARSRAGQGYGPLRIRAELKEARVPEERIRAAFEAIECDFTQVAQELHARRFGRVPGRGAEWQKQYRFLAMRGFDAEQIRAVLKGDPEDGDQG